jgi:hypothetical protein
MSQGPYNRDTKMRCAALQCGKEAPQTTNRTFLDKASAHAETTHGPCQPPILMVRYLQTSAYLAQEHNDDRISADLADHLA